MRLGKRTEKLVREAAVAGFVMGTRWAGWHPPPGVPAGEDAFPLDSEIVSRAYRCAAKFPDCYPTLSKAEQVHDEAARARAENLVLIKALMEARHA